MDVGLKLYT